MQTASRHIVSSRASRGSLRVACSTTAVATKPAAKTVDLKSWQALNVTKANLVDSQGGETTRNIDGVVYYISYDKAADDIVVVDRKKGLRFPAAVGDDNRIRINTQAPMPHAVAGFSVDAFQDVLKATAPGAELSNGRVAMLGFLGCALTEVISGQSTVQQVTSPAGAALAVAAGLLVLAASVAPAVAGKVPAQKVFPSENDSYPDGPLPYFWTAAAEKVNGRVAMVGMAGLLINEVVRGAALL